MLWQPITDQRSYVLNRSSCSLQKRRGGLRRLYWLSLSIFVWLPECDESVWVTMVRCRILTTGIVSLEVKLNLSRLTLLGHDFYAVYPLYIVFWFRFWARVVYRIWFTNGNLDLHVLHISWSPILFWITCTAQPLLLLNRTQFYCESSLSSFYSALLSGCECM